MVSAHHLTGLGPTALIYTGKAQRCCSPGCWSTVGFRDTARQLLLNSPARHRILWKETEFFSLNKHCYPTWLPQFFRKHLMQSCGLRLWLVVRTARGGAPHGLLLRTPSKTAFPGVNTCLATWSSDRPSPDRPHWGGHSPLTPLTWSLLMGLLNLDRPDRK